MFDVNKKYWMFDANIYSIFKSAFKFEIGKFSDFLLSKKIWGKGNRKEGGRGPHVCLESVLK
jgi:hypothetical protein